MYLGLKNKKQTIWKIVKNCTSSISRHGFQLKSYFFLRYQWKWLLFFISGVDQSLSHVWLSATPWTAACQASLSFANSQSLLKLMSTESVMPSNHLIFCCPPLLLPSIFPRIRVFSNESALQIWWPKYWNVSFSISPSSEYSGLISFRSDWFDLLAVQWTLKSLLQHNRSKASILQCSAFFIVRLSKLREFQDHDYLENHSFDYMDLYRQSNISVFQYGG